MPRRNLAIVDPIPDPFLDVSQVQSAFMFAGELLCLIPYFLLKVL